LQLNFVVASGHEEARAIELHPSDVRTPSQSFFFTIYSRISYVVCNTSSPSTADNAGHLPSLPLQFKKKNITLVESGYGIDKARV